MLSKMADALFRNLALLYLAVQAGDHLFQLTCAFLNSLLQLLASGDQSRLGRLAVGNIHDDPNDALAQVVRVYRFAANVTPEPGAILADQFHLCFKGAA